MTDLPLILPDWPAPPNVHAVVSTRAGGVSVAPWDSLNLGSHVGDDAAAVQGNRARLLAALQTIAPCAEPRWLNQVHGVAVVDAAAACDAVPDADASVSSVKGQPCVVMTADCLPVFFADAQGRQVAVAHAGWRGLCDGVLEATLARFPEPSAVLAWLGPAIGPQAFEVGSEVRAAFMARAAEAADCFMPGTAPGKWLADIYGLARQRLQSAGVQQIYGGDFCTVTDAKRFFSYRRDGRTGRMASVIWLS